MAKLGPWQQLINLQKSTIQTPQQILGMSTKQAKAREAAALAAQQAITDAEVARYNAQANRAQGFASALGELSKAGATATEQGYARAAERLSGLGAGLTGAVAESYQSGVDKSREAVARLTGGLGQVSAPSAADMRSASLYSGVTVPAAGLSDLAASHAGLARAQNLARTAGIGNIARDYLAQSDLAIAEGARQKRALVAQRPANIQELVQQLTENRAAGISNLANLTGQRLGYQETIRQNKFDRKLKWATYLTSQTALMNSTNSTTAQIQATRQAAARSWSELKGYVTDWRGNPKYDNNGKLTPIAGWKLNKAGTGVVQVPTPGEKTVGGRDIDTTLSDRYGIQMYGDGTPKLVKKNGAWQVVPYPGKPGAKPKPMSVKDRQAWTADINTAVDNLVNGFEDPENPANNVKAVGAAEALQQMNDWGYLSSPALSKIAMAALLRAYPTYSDKVDMGLVAGPSVTGATPGAPGEAKPGEPSKGPRGVPGTNWLPLQDPVVARNIDGKGTNRTTAGFFVRNGKYVEYEG